MRNQRRPSLGKNRVFLAVAVIVGITVGAMLWHQPALTVKVPVSTVFHSGEIDDPGLQMKPDPTESLVDVVDSGKEAQIPVSLHHNVSRSHYLTAVVMSYPKSSRFHLLEQIIRKVNQWDFVWEIILVWNGPIDVLPDTIQRFFKESPRKPVSGDDSTTFAQRHKLRVHHKRPFFTILPQSLNRVDNRWRIAEHIDTDAILNMDDDINLHVSGAQCMLQVWRSSPSALVAIDVRSHFVHAKEGGGPHGPFGYVARDRSAGFKQYSIALPRALLTNREYYVAYDAAWRHKSDESPTKKGVKEIVDELLCDDIAFNFVAAKTRLPSNEQLSGGHVVYVKAKYAAYPESHSADGMTKKEGMKTMRQKCVNELAKHVGGSNSGKPDGMLLLHRPWHVLCDVDG